VLTPTHATPPPALLASQEKGVIKPVVSHAKQAIYTRSVQAAA
jgi:ribosomal protein S25